MCVYIYMYTYMHTYIYMYTYTYTYTYSYTYTHIHIYIYTYIHMYTCLYLYTYTHVCIYIYTGVCGLIATPQEIEQFKQLDIGTTSNPGNKFLSVTRLGAAPPVPLPEATAEDETSPWNRSNWWFNNLTPNNAGLTCENCWLPEKWPFIVISPATLGFS